MQPEQLTNCRCPRLMPAALARMCTYAGYTPREPLRLCWTGAGKGALGCLQRAMGERPGQQAVNPKLRIKALVIFNQN